MFAVDHWICIKKEIYAESFKLYNIMTHVCIAHALAGDGIDFRYYYYFFRFFFVGTISTD